MKLSYKLYLPLIAFFILVAAVFVYSRINTVNPPQTAQDEPLELREVKLPELNPEELDEYYAVYKNPFVLYLRKALSAYLANDGTAAHITVGAVEKVHRDGIITGLDAFDKEYYKSKFVVITFSESVAGGADIQVMFQDKPDRIFYAWVYRLADGDYELRGWNSKEYFDPDKMKAFNNTYKELLLDKEHAL